MKISVFDTDNKIVDKLTLKLDVGWRTSNEKNNFSRRFMEY